MNHRMTIVPFAAAAIFLVILSAGCASHPATEAPAALSDFNARSLLVLRGHTGKPYDWRELIAEAAACDAVFIGEIHNHAIGQAFQAAFFRDLLATAPAAGCALEFYGRQHQAVMDDYLDGLIDREELSRLTDRSAGDDCPGHRAMIDACKERDRPVIAANAPRRYVKVARTDGYERLSALGPEQRRLFRVPESLPTGRYRDEFFEQMQGEGGGGAGDGKDAAHATEDQARIEGMFRAQTLWDWTMADSVARAIDDPNGPARPVVLVVGKFHTDFDGGLVQALKAIRPKSRIFTITFESEGGPLLDDKNRDTANAIVFVGPEGKR